MYFFHHRSPWLDIFHSPQTPPRLQSYLASFLGNYLKYKPTYNNRIWVHMHVLSCCVCICAQRVMGICEYVHARLG